MKRDNLLPLILCGGTGSRLWPLSRESYPKQYIDLIGDSSKTLLQQTLERLRGIENQDDPILICNEEHRFIVAEQLRAINVSPKKIMFNGFFRRMNRCAARELVVGNSAVSYTHLTLPTKA